MDKNFENTTIEEKLRMTLHRDVRAITAAVSHELGLEMMTPAMELVAEVAYHKLKVFAKDLEQFAKHAKRNTINTDDVKLLVRRNPTLKNHITSLIAVNQTTGKKRKSSNALLELQPPSAKNTRLDAPGPSIESLPAPRRLDAPGPSEPTTSKSNRNDVSLDFLDDLLVADATIDLTFD